MFALRGATTVERNVAAEIEEAGGRLLRALVEANSIGAEHLVSAVFTCTPDLDAAFPATGARKAGFDGLAMLCATEMAVPGAPAHVVRVLLHVNGQPAAGGPRHVYLGGARVLRPDWAGAD